TPALSVLIRLLTVSPRYAAYDSKVPMAFNCIYALDAAIEASLAPLVKGFERQHNSAVCVVPKHIRKYDKVNTPSVKASRFPCGGANVRYWITAFKSGHEEQVRSSSGCAVRSGWKL